MYFIDIIVLKLLQKYIRLPGLLNRVKKHNYAAGGKDKFTLPNFNQREEAIFKI